jgi:hypothetical protein
MWCLLMKSQRKFCFFWVEMPLTLRVPIFIVCVIVGGSVSAYFSPARRFSAAQILLSGFPGGQKMVLMFSLSLDDQ